MRAFAITEEQLDLIEDTLDELVGRQSKHARSILATVRNGQELRTAPAAAEQAQPSAKPSGPPPPLSNGASPKSVDPEKVAAGAAATAVKPKAEAS